MTSANPQDLSLDTINLCELSHFEQGCPHHYFDFLRREAPVWFHPGNEQTPEGEGFWVISRYHDARQVLKDHESFSSETGYGAREGGGTILQDLAKDMGPGQVLAMMDPPKHDDIRALVNQGFMPRTLQYMEGEIRKSVDRILATIKGKQEVDFLNEVAAQLPLEVICKMGGVPEADWPQMMRWADAAIAYAAFDPRNDTDKLIAELTEMGMYAFELIERIRKEPNESVMSQVIHAEIPGEDGKPRKLDELELIRFFNLLITGGTETTRNAIAYGLYQLIVESEQRKAVADNPGELLEPAIEEMLRWSSPVHFNRRTASCDITLQGQQIRRGDKVTVWYPSANRDEAVFDNPHSFSIYRKKTSHIAFGQGIHHCIGAALARLEMKVLYGSFLEQTRGRHIEALNPIRFIRSNRHQGVAEMRIAID